MTKQEILDEFDDINFVYNNSSKHETLSWMLDELLKEQEAVPVDNGKCPSCNWDFENGELDFSNINESRFYCPRCGQAVRWE